MRYDPISLRLFVAIAQTGSISAAAERMKLALAAASRRVVALESDVGAQLLERRARGVTLTPAGSALLRHAQEIQDGYERMRAEMAEHAAGSRGSVRIMANSSSVLQFLPLDLPGFLACHPEIRIDLTERTSDEIVRAVQAGTAELGVYHPRSEDPLPGLERVPYRRDELVLLVPSSSAFARRRQAWFEEVLDQPFVAFPPATALRSVVVAAAQAHGAALTVRIQVRGFDALVRMVAAGLGVGVLPREAMGATPHAGVRVLALRDDWAWRQHCLVHRPEAALAPPARLLARFLAQRGQA